MTWRVLLSLIIHELKSFVYLKSFSSSVITDSKLVVGRRHMGTRLNKTLDDHVIWSFYQTNLSGKCSKLDSASVANIPIGPIWSLRKEKAVSLPYIKIPVVDFQFQKKLYVFKVYTLPIEDTVEYRSARLKALFSQRIS